MVVKSLLSIEGHAVALRFRVSAACVRRVKQERRELGKVAPSRTRRRTPKWVAYADRIRVAVAEKPDRTLRELKEYLQTDLSVQTLCRALWALKLTFKKKCWLPQSKSD